MSAVMPKMLVAHFNCMVNGLTQSSDLFYKSVEQGLSEHQLKNVQVERVTVSQSGIFSTKREYLQVRRNDLVFHICAAPFGNGFFVSWWLGYALTGFRAFLAGIPYIGRFFSLFVEPITYYSIDTADMFRSVLHSAVLASVDKATEEKGVRALKDTERSPVIRDFFSQKMG